MEHSSSTSSSKTGLKQKIQWILFLLAAFVVLDRAVYEVLFIGVDGSHRIVRGLGQSRVLVVGSSHVLWDVQDQQLAKEISLSTHKIGIAGADIRARVAIAEEYMTRSAQAPSWILLETDRYVFHPKRYRIPREALLPYWHQGMFHSLLNEAWGDDLLFKVSTFSRALSVNGEYNSFLERIVLKIESARADQIEQWAKTLSEYPEEVDQNLVNRLESFLKLAQSKSVRVVFVETPNVHLPTTAMVFPKTASILEHLSNAYQVPYLRPFQAEESKAEWFFDASHLNSAGAEEFTKRLAQSLRGYLK